MADDFEIRRQEPSGLARELGLDYPLFVVWDLQADKRVPFGNYRRHDQAVARIIRMRDRAASRCAGCLRGGCPECDHQEVPRG